MPTRKSADNTEATETSTATKTTAARKPRSATTKAPAKRAAPKATTPRASKKTVQWIRNLRGTYVHLRLYSQSPKDPYRIELKPRGQQGDATSVPVQLLNDATLVQAEGVLVEFITEAEAKNAQYGPVGYLGRDDAPVIIRPEDTTVTTAKDWDGTGRRAPQEREVVRTQRGQQASEREFGTGMHTADVPGSDAALHAGLRQSDISNAERAGSSALPPEADLGSRRVVVERTRG